MILEDGSEYPDEPDLKCAIVRTSALLPCSMKVSPLFPRSLPDRFVHSAFVPLVFAVEDLSDILKVKIVARVRKVNEDGTVLGLVAAGSKVLIGPGF